MAKALALNKTYNLDSYADGSARNKFLLNNNLLVIYPEKDNSGGILTVVIPKESYNLSEDFKKYCPERSLLDFIQKCLILEPTKRLSVEAAMEHEFIKKTFFE